MIIAIPDDYQQIVTRLDCFRTLEGHDVRVSRGPTLCENALVAELRDAEVIVPIRERTAITRTLIARLPHLKHVAQTGRSAHTVDIAACTERGIAVSAGTHASPSTIAEHAWALILTALRDIPGQIVAMKHGAWSPHLSLGLEGKILGIHGLGKIGSLVARTGQSFGMTVLACGGDGSRKRAAEAGYEFARNQRELYERSDVLSMHLRLVDETRHSVTAEDLAAMKSTALFVNTARAEVVAPGALVAALGRGRPGYAAVDVYEDEPVLGGDHPLLRLDNAYCTPHSAWIERGMYEMYFGEAFDNVMRYASGEPVNLLNPEVRSQAAQQRAGISAA